MNKYIASISWLVPGERIRRSPERVQEDTLVAVKPAALPDSMLPKVPPAPPIPRKLSLAVLPSSPQPSPVPSVLPSLPPDTVPVSGKHSASGTDTTGSLSFPFRYQSFNDTALHEMQQKMQQYAQKMQQYAQKMQQQFNSDEWKKYQQEIRTYGQKLKDYFNSTEWKEQQERVREEAEKIKQQFNSGAWRQHIDSIRQQVVISRDSLLARVGGQIAWSGPGNTATMVLSSNRHTARPSRLARMLMEDGLLKNDKDYTIRLNDGGLYVNGKKQAQQYFEKYRRIVGDQTSLKIKKKNGHTQTTINTSETKHSKSVSL